MRFTEYHCGTAVIKDKSRISEAMKKLAIYEDIEENNSRIQDTLAELRAHRDAYMKNSLPWRVINRAVNLLIGLNAEVEVLRQKENHIGDVSKMVDLVEVTRCKDCKYRIDGYCDVWSYCGHEKVKEVDFCSYGEKVKQ